MVNLALENTGFYPERSSNTLAALVNLSPDSPTQQLITSLAILGKIQSEKIRSSNSEVSIVNEPILEVEINVCQNLNEDIKGESGRKDSDTGEQRIGQVKNCPDSPTLARSVNENQSGEGDGGRAELGIEDVKRNAQGEGEGLSCQLSSAVRAGRGRVQDGGSQSSGDSSLRKEPKHGIHVNEEEVVSENVSNDETSGETLGEVEVQVGSEVQVYIELCAGSEQAHAENGT